MQTSASRHPRQQPVPSANHLPTVSRTFGTHLRRATDTRVSPPPHAALGGSRCRDCSHCSRSEASSKGVTSGRAGARASASQGAGPRESGTQEDRGSQHPAGRTCGGNRGPQPRNQQAHSGTCPSTGEDSAAPRQQLEQRQQQQQLRVSPRGGLTACSRLEHQVY